MSLLMDALKKAEAAKQQAQSPDSRPPKLDFSIDDSPPSPPPMTPSATATASPLPELAHHSASVDAELASVAAATTRHRPPPSPPPPVTHPEKQEIAERQAVRNVFHVKQPAATRSRLWLLLAFAVAATVVIAAYFWWQLQFISSAPLRLTQQAPSPLPAQTATTSTPPPPPTANAGPTASPSETPPPSRSLANGTSATTQPPAKAPELFTLARTPQREPAPARPARELKQSGKTLVSTQNNGLHFNKTTGTTQLETAYDALQAQRLDEAQQAYARVLRGDSRNLDALLGLATIAIRQGKADDALAWYQRALDVDPTDPTAQAALVNLRSQGDPGLAESRLQTAIASQPESAALYFALGNLYARQQRWSEAQQAYFTAFTREGNNADYMFNLAVSLDHLHQNKLAAQYYQMAVSAAQTAHSVSFDPNQARKRAVELQP